MEPKHLFLGGLALAVVGGSALGAGMDTTPIRKGGDPLGSVPAHEFALRDPSAAKAMLAPYDQYAIETPEGRFEVAELSARGLYRNRPYGPRYYAEAIEDNFGPPVDASLASADWQPDVNFADAEIARSTLAARADAAEMAARAAAAEDGPVEEAPRSMPTEGAGSGPAVQARSIDVAVEVAALN